MIEKNQLNASVEKSRRVGRCESWTASSTKFAWKSRRVNPPLILINVLSGVIIKYVPGRCFFRKVTTFHVLPLCTSFPYNSAIFKLNTASLYYRLPKKIVGGISFFFVYLYSNFCTYPTRFFGEDLCLCFYY